MSSQELFTTILAGDYKNDGANRTEQTDESFCKLFVGGIKVETTEDTLRTFYEQYGELTDCVIMKDPNTKKSRGFGFVTYKNRTMVDDAMKNRPHIIDDKTVDPKRAVPKDAANKNESNISTKRLYVSGVRDSHTEEMFQEYFSNYGQIEKIDIITEKPTGKPRGFAFVTFDDYDPVDQCILERSHMIGGHRCDVKKALNKDEMVKAQTQRDRTQRFQQSRGMGGRNPNGGYGPGWNQGYQQPPYGQQSGWGDGGGGGNWGQQGGWNQGQAGWGQQGQAGWGQPPQAGAGGWGQQQWGPPASNGGWQGARPN